MVLALLCDKFIWVQKAYLYQMTPTPPNLIALILCGGKSNRMGRPKAFIQYHGIPQYAFVERLCAEAQIAGFVSCNPAQVEAFNKLGANPIADKNQFVNCGPLTGVLSAYEEFPNQAILVLGCDYPNLDLNHVLALKEAYTGSLRTVCFQNPSTQIDEPLLTIYHHQDLKQLHNQFTLGKNSLRQFLQEIKPVRLKPINNSVLMSFDTPEDFQSFTEPSVF